MPQRRQAVEGSSPDLCAFRYDESCSIQTVFRHHCSALRRSVNPLCQRMPFNAHLGCATMPSLARFEAECDTVELWSQSRS